MARTKSHNKKQIQEEVRRRVEAERTKQLYGKKLQDMTLGERFQHDAHDIVKSSQFLQEHEGARWAHIPVTDTGKSYVGLLFDADHWTIIQGELIYHPSGTYAMDGIVFSSVEPLLPDPSRPRHISPPPNIHPSLYNPHYRSFINEYGLLQVVPVQRVRK